MIKSSYELRPVSQVNCPILPQCVGQDGTLLKSMEHVLIIVFLCKKICLEPNKAPGDDQKEIIK